jgi:hypothetical protein
MAIVPLNPKISHEMEWFLEDGKISSIGGKFGTKSGVAKEGTSGKDQGRPKSGF